MVLCLFILFSNGLQKGVNAAQGVFIEMFITGALVLSVLMLAAEKHTATPFAPVRYSIHHALHDLIDVMLDWHRTDALRLSFVRFFPDNWAIVVSSEF
jgi:glycerol uptake facilitator-like aquaporin